MKSSSVRDHARAAVAVLAAAAAALIGGTAVNEVAYADQYTQAGLDTTTTAAMSSQSWLAVLSGLDRRGMGGGAIETNAVLAQKTALTETAAQRVRKNQSAVLTQDRRIGDFAAPIKRFRDGGHAYYLFGRGLHSCTYVGKCMDLFAPVGEPVYAMGDGVVLVPPYAGGSYGHHALMKFRDGSTAIYAHLQKVIAKPGPVKAGTLLGTVGCSGTSGEFNGCDSSDPHLHLEWSALSWSDGEYGEIPPAFDKWRGRPARCYQGC